MKAKFTKINILLAIVISLLLAIIALLIIFIKTSSITTSENLNGEKTRFLTRVESISDVELKNVNPKDVYTFTCEIVEQKPREQTTTCADFGITIHSINWDMWEASGASGKGIYSVLNCEPSCADGNREEVPVEVKLSGLMTDGSKYYLTKLNAYSLNGSTLKVSHMFPWDLADFYLYYVKNEE